MVISSVALVPKVEASEEPGVTSMSPAALAQARTRLYSMMSCNRYFSHSSGYSTRAETNLKTVMALC